MTTIELFFLLTYFTVAEWVSATVALWIGIRKGEGRCLLPFQIISEWPHPWLLIRAEPVSCESVLLVKACSVSQQLNRLPTVNMTTSVNPESECLCSKKDIFFTSNLLPKCNERKIWEFVPLIAKKNCLGWLGRKISSFLQVIMRISQLNSCECSLFSPYSSSHMKLPSCPNLLKGNQHLLKLVFFRVIPHDLLRHVLIFKTSKSVFARDRLLKKCLSVSLFSM